MEFYIQMGHGMQSMCRELSDLWGGSTVILSPLNIAPDKLSPFSESLQAANGKVLVDPQMYSPRKFHKNLQRYSYWPKSEITSIELGAWDGVLTALSTLNEQAQSEAFILPSATTQRAGDLWGEMQGMIATRAEALANGKSLIHTIALGKDVLAEEAQVETIIQYASQWDVDGVYIVCEHPDSYYLVDRPLWVTNLLALVAGIKRLNKKVIVGYASHQLLCLAMAKCDAIAAGNYLNVRWFKPERFITNDNNEPSRRSTWYYCPQAFSEYKLTYLDVAKREEVRTGIDVLSRMAPPESMANQYSRILFEGAMPSSTNYNEGASHRHYLHCLKVQSEFATKATYEETRDSHLALLNTASRLISGLQEEGIRGQDRDFGEIVDVIEAAVSVFNKEFGFAMSQEWNL